MSSFHEKKVYYPDDQNTTLIPPDLLKDDAICSDCIDNYIPPFQREIFPFDVIDKETFPIDGKSIIVIGNSGIGKEGKVTRIGSSKSINVNLK